MNKYTEQQIEEQLKQLSSIEPSGDSVRRMNQNIRNIISGVEKKRAAHGFLYYALTSAAMLIIGISLLYNSMPIKTPPSIVQYIPTEATLTLAKLNNVFNHGGQKALDEYFEKVEANRQPRADSLTLQEIMKEL